MTDPDSIITIRWSALSQSPVNLNILSYAHTDDLLAHITSLKILHGVPWSVKIAGPRLVLTIKTARCSVFHEFAQHLVTDYGCTHAEILERYAAGAV